MAKPLDGLAMPVGRHQVEDGLVHHVYQTVFGYFNLSWRTLMPNLPFIIMDVCRVQVLFYLGLLFTCILLRKFATSEQTQYRFLLPECHTDSRKSTENAK